MCLMSVLIVVAVAGTECNRVIELKQEPHIANPSAE